jgi:uncharacterized protein DUF4864
MRGPSYPHLTVDRGDRHRRARARGRWTAAALVLVAVPLVAAGVAHAQAERDPKAAGEPVMKQLEAFRRDDYDTAYTFASQQIRALFDRASFERMVKGGYPEIARSAFAIVAETELAADGHVRLRVKVRGANGIGVEAIYDMVWEGDRWRINGVVTRPDQGLL